MVDLNLPRQRLITTEAPQERLSARDYQSANDSIATGLRKLGQGAEDIAVPLAEKQGKADAAGAVTLDENGKIQINDAGSSFIMGRAGGAYASAKETELMVANRSKVDQDLMEIRQRNDGNPAGFQKDSADYLNARRDANVNGLGQQTFDYGLRSMTQHYNGLVENKAARDFKQTADVFAGRMSTLNGQQQSLVMQGISSGEEWDRIQAEKAQIRGEMERNPRFNYNAALRKQDEDADRLQHGALAVAYEARGRIRNGESVEAVQKDVEDRLIKMGLPSDQVQKFIGLARSNMAGTAAARTAERERATADADLAIAKLKGGDTLSDAEFTPLVARLAANGGEKKAADLIAQKRLHEEIIPMIRFGNAQERAEAMGSLKELQQSGVNVPGVRAGRTGPGMPASAANLNANEVGLLNAIAGPESAGLYNVRYTGAGAQTFNRYDDHPRQRERIASGPNAGSTSDAAGRYQFLSSTWDSLPAEAKGDGKFTPENQDRAALYLAKRDYRARTGRDLMADIDENGMTPEILKALGPTWEGFQSEAGRKKAMAAFNGASTGVAQQLPVRETVIKDVQKSYDEYIGPVAQRITDAYNRGVPPTQEDMADFQSMYPLTSKSDEKGVLAKLYEAENKYAISQQLPTGEGLRAFVATMDQAEREGKASPAGVVALKVAKDAQGEQEKLLKNDPLELGRRMWSSSADADLYGRRGVIDWSNPDAVIGELSLRRHQSDLVRAQNPGASQMPLYEDDRKQLAQMLPAMNADQAKAALYALRTTFTPEQMKALMGDEGVRGAITGLTRNPDPGKMKAGFDFMSAQLQDNPLEFRQTFGDGEEKKLYQYQVLSSAMTPEQVSERLTKAQSPRDADTRKRWESDAAAAMNGMTSEKLFKEIQRDQSGFMKYWSGFGIDRPLRQKELAGVGYDYAEAYKSHYGEFGDEAAAKAYAVDRVKQNWGSSEASGRLMRYPPDRVVPKVDGSHEWLKEQLQGDVIKALGVDMAKVNMATPSWLTPPGSPVNVPNGLPSLSANEQKAQAIINGDYDLVADSKTESDIAAGRPPSYIVMVKNPNGMPEQLAIDPGKMMRWVPDHKAALEQARFGYGTEDQTRRTIRNSMGYLPVRTIR